MEPYAHLRPDTRPSAAELERAAERASTVGSEVVRTHASCADLPVDEIVRAANTVVMRPDPSTLGA